MDRQVSGPPALSILIPHLREAENDKALRVCLDCIAANTQVDYELVIEAVATRRDIYAVCNRMVEKAAGEWVVFGNSDVFVGPNWIEPLYELRDKDTIVSPIMVECGAIGVNVLNYEKDFGRTPETFRRDEFEAWVKAGGEWRDGERAWYFPSLLSREAFLSLGGFDLTKGQFPHEPLDIIFWNTWEASGRKFRRARSWVYHLQFWSSTERQTKR